MDDIIYYSFLKVFLCESPEEQQPQQRTLADTEVLTQRTSARKSGRSRARASTTLGDASSELQETLAGDLAVGRFAAYAGWRTMEYGRL